jgi:hypothetical protein
MKLASMEITQNFIFEEDNFDSFIDKLTSINYIEYVHDVYEHKWGQRVVDSMI